VARRRQALVRGAPEEGVSPERGATLRGRAHDDAGDLPGAQLNDPDRVAQAGVHDQRLPAKRRSRGK